MLEIKENYRGRLGDPTCPLCHLETDTTEHLFKFEKLKEWNLDGQTHEDLRENDQIVMQSIGVYIEKVIGIRDNVMARQLGKCAG